MSRAPWTTYRARPEDRGWLTRGALLYTTCDEDARSELRALELGPDDVAVSITGSGCRSLSLLAAGPARVVSVDANPLQNHLLELKVAGIRALDREGFLAFFGVLDSPADVRIARYDALRDDLSAAAREFWDRNRRIIGGGVAFSGAHESFYRWFIGPLIRGLRPRRTRELFAFDDLAEQAAFYRTKWDHVGWRTAVRALAQPLSMRLILGDPSYYAQVERDEGFGPYLMERLRVLFDHQLARDNDVFQLYVLGRYLSGGTVPHYLLPGVYDDVRAHLDRLEIVTMPIDRYLAELPPASVDKVSLSDISGWIGADDFERVLGDAQQACRPGGRVCYRNFLADRPWPSSLTGARPLLDLGAELASTDRAFAFTFVVAERIPENAVQS